MKRLLLGLLIFQFFTFAAHAQIEKGSIMLGGKINYNNSNSNSDANYEDFSTFSDGKTNQFTFNPQVGFTLNNNWILGVYGNVYSSKTTSENNSLGWGGDTSVYYSHENETYGGGVFTRKYIPFSEHFSAFGEVSIGAGRQKASILTKSVSGNTTTTDESEGKYNVFQGSFLAGLAYFPKDWLAIELSTNLVTFTHSDNIIADSNSNSFDFGLNASAINLGVSFFLNNK